MFYGESHRSLAAKRILTIIRARGGTLTKVSLTSSQREPTLTPMLGRMLPRQSTLYPPLAGKALLKFVRFSGI